MGACKGEVLPEFRDVYKLQFYLALRIEGTAILNKKLHCNGILPRVKWAASSSKGGKSAMRRIQISQMESTSCGICTA
jgi:hypothetical protein